MEPARIKICGVTSIDDALAAVELGAWAVGMVFYEGSPRRCSVEQAERIGAALHRRNEVAGVFVNATLEEIADVAERAKLTLVQLHGDEGPVFAGEVARRTGARTIKAMAVRGPATLQDIKRFHTDFHLLDGYAPDLRGGTGERVDLSLLATRRSKVPLIVSGGLRPENVGEVLDRIHPYAVDVASGVEQAPGIKDHYKMRAFMDAVAEGAATEPQDHSIEAAVAPAEAPA
jgi:phosphoribosylanthranilate isomerase